MYEQIAKMSKMDFKLIHKCDKIVKQIMKQTGPENLHMEMTKQGETQALQSLIFASLPAPNRSFSFFRFVESVLQKAPKALRN